MKHKLDNKGFTLPEMLIAVFILVVVFTGSLVTFIRCQFLNEQSRASAAALNAAKAKLAEIENTPFANIQATYDETTFTEAGLTGMGVTYVDNSDPTLLLVTVTFTWQQNDGRIMGDDTDMDGEIDAGEDDDGDGMLDSPIMFTTAITSI